MSGVSTAVRHNGQILLKESQASIQSAQKMWSHAFIFRTI